MYRSMDTYELLVHIFLMLSRVCSNSVLSPESSSMEFKRRDVLYEINDNTLVPTACPILKRI